MGSQKEKAVEDILWVLLLARDRFSRHAFLLLSKPSRDKELKESKRSGITKETENMGKVKENRASKAKRRDTNEDSGGARKRAPECGRSKLWRINRLACQSQNQLFMERKKVASKPRKIELLGS